MKHKKEDLTKISRTYPKSAESKITTKGTLTYLIRYMAQVISDVTTDIASQENSSGDCERPHILNQSKILEMGSLKG